MSELTLMQQWAVPPNTADAILVADISVECEGFAFSGTFKGPETEQVTLEVPNTACILTHHIAASAVETEASCEGIVVALEPKTCAFVSTTFAEGVPTLTWAGTGILIALLGYLAWRSLQTG